MYSTLENNPLTLGLLLGLLLIGYISTLLWKKKLRSSFKVTCFRYLIRYLKDTSNISAGELLFSPTTLSFLLFTALTNINKTCCSIKRMLGTTALPLHLEALCCTQSRGHPTPPHDKNGWWKASARLLCVCRLPANQSHRGGLCRSTHPISWVC